MEWYNYLAAFFAGAVLANALPHFIKGISGDKFPTPFSKPPGKGLSSAVINTVWGLFNFVIGCLLFSAGKIAVAQCLTLLIFFIGICAMSVTLSVNFQKKDRE